jgi:hypothetical protein
MYLFALNMLRSVFMTETKHPGGRPTDYRPEYCEVVKKCLNKGMSIMSIARKLQVSKQTLYDWKDAHPQFLDAVKKGIDFSQGWWEDKGRKNLHCKDFNHVLWMMNMRNRFRAEWNEKQEEKIEDKKDEINADRELLHKCKTE